MEPNGLDKAPTIVATETDRVILASGNSAILGARRDTRYRTNVGIVNLSLSAQTYRVAVLGSFGTEVRQVDVPAFSMTLFGITGAASATPLQIQVQNVSTGSTQFVAYASSTSATL